MKAEDPDLLSKPALTSKVEILSQLATDQDSGRAVWEAWRVFNANDNSDQFHSFSGLLVHLEEVIAVIVLAPRAEFRRIT